MLRNLFKEGAPVLAFIAEMRQEYQEREEVTDVMAAHAIAAAGFPTPRNDVYTYLQMDFDRFRDEMLDTLRRRASSQLAEVSRDVSVEFADALYAGYCDFQDGERTRVEVTADLAAAFGLTYVEVERHVAGLHNTFTSEVFVYPGLDVAASRAVSAAHRLRTAPYLRNQPDAHSIEGSR